uniref:Gal-NAc6S n=1 Tax=Loxodonta africana TaxID=9785 RepID=G3TST0_LOXAF
CSTCLHTPGESDWFDKRFERAIEPLHSSEVPMSSDALILRMLSGVQSKSEMQFTNRKQQQQTEVSPCRTCAVVGNSWFLRDSGLGFRINQHDVVLRMNQAPVQGFETDVGNTTTMRIMYPEAVRIQDPGTQLLVLPMNSSGLQRFMNTLFEDSLIFQIAQFPGGNKKSKDKVLVISLTFLKYIQENWLKKQGQYPSLGLVALFYALHTCDQVSLFGFGTDNLQRWSHYWDDKYWFMNNMHNPKAEYNIILRLWCEGKVVIYK